MPTYQVQQFSSYCRSSQLTLQQGVGTSTAITTPLAEPCSHKCQVKALAEIIKVSVNEFYLMFIYDDLLKPR